MNVRLYLVGIYADGEFRGFIHAGRPWTIRVYESIESANRGIKQQRKNREYKILEVGTLEVVDIENS